MCAGRINSKTREYALSRCNRALKVLNLLSLLRNPADTKTAIFAPSMRSLCVAQLYRQYIAVSMKYIAYSRLRERAPPEPRHRAVSAVSRSPVPSTLFADMSPMVSVMARMLLRRLLLAVPLVFAVVTLTFFLIRLAPGDPATILAGDAPTPEFLAQIRAEYGLDRPVGEQFVAFLAKAVTGDFGTSL